MKQVYEGSIISRYDPDSPFVVHVSTGSGDDGGEGSGDEGSGDGGSGSTGDTIYMATGDTLNIAEEIDTVIVEDGVVEIISDGDTTHVSGDDFVVNGGGGDTYVVSGGEVTHTGTGGTSGPAITHPEDIQLQVQFMRSPQQQYGFDRLRYPAMESTYMQWDNRGESEAVPWKSMQVSGSEEVLAHITGSDTLFSAGDVKFRSLSGTPYNSISTGEADVVKVMLQGAPMEQQEGIEAWVSYTDTAGNEQEVVVGYLGGASYDNQEIKLILVPFNSEREYSLSSIDYALDSIYGKAVSHWNTSLDDPFWLDAEAWDVDPENGALDDGESGLLSKYPKECNKIRRQYKGNRTVDGQAYYIFLLDDISSASGKQGFMPLKSQFAFVYTKNKSTAEIAQLVAHELGHGAFHLRHTFSEEADYSIQKGTTNNLMDYSNATHLHKWQWDYIHNPEGGLYLFQDEEEAAYSWSFFGEKYARLFNHVYDNNNEDNSDYLAKINGAGSNETIKLEYTESEINKWSKDEKAFIDSWSIGTYDGDKIAKSVFNKIKSAKKDAEIEDINLSANRIYIGSFTIGDKAYPVATYAPKGAVSGIKKITVTESEVLERTDTIKHIYCDETYTKYLIIAFYKEGAEKTDPSLIMQIEKFIGDDTKDKWLEHLGVLVEKTKPPVVTDTIKIFITRTNTGTNSTTGTLKTDDETITGYTVELPRGNDSECKTSCADDEIPFDCHCIIEGVYEFEINTKVYDAGSPKNHSFRITSTVKNGRSGVLVHGGRDDAKGWSMGCILPMPNEPEKNSDLYSQGRNNTKTQSVDFTKTIIDWVKQREAEIKKNNKDIKKVEKRIIITKTF